MKKMIVEAILSGASVSFYVNVPGIGRSFLCSAVIGDGIITVRPHVDTHQMAGATPEQVRDLTSVCYDMADTLYTHVTRDPKNAPRSSLRPVCLPIGGVR